MPEPRNRWVAELVRDYDPVAARLLQSYNRMLPILRKNLNDLQDTMQKRLEKTGYADAITQRELQTMNEWIILRKSIEEEMADFAVIARDAAGTLSDDALIKGAKSAKEMTSATVSDELAGVIAGVWNEPDPEALARLGGYVDGDAMRGKFASFGKNAADDVSNVVYGMIAQGKNPRVIASAIEKWLSLPYSWAENMTRTVQIYSYRTANHATFAANPQVLDGWMWSASLDERVCMSCVSQHGRIFRLNEILNDHHRGRCAPIPVVKGSNWVRQIQTGPRCLARTRSA